MKTNAFLSCLALTLVSTAVLADSYYASASDDVYTQCLNSKDTINNMIVYECSDLASTDARKRMTLSYNKIYASLKKDSPEDAVKLEESQLAWIEYRDKYCDMAGRYVGSPMYEYCPAQLNMERANQLEEMAQSF